MQDVQLGKIISILDKNKIERLASDLREKFKPITLRYYQSDLPPSLLLGGPKNARKSTKDKANYVQVFWGRKKMLEFYGKDIRGNGHIFDENLGKNELEDVLGILVRNNMYTFRTWKDKNLGLRAMMLLFGAIDLLLGAAVLALSWILGAAAIMFGLLLITLYIK